MQHPGQALPLVDVCLCFFFEGEVTASFIQFFIIVHIQMVTLK